MDGWTVVRSAAASLLVYFLAFPGGTTQAQGVEGFYRGKNVDILVGYAAGGLNDLLARVVSRHMPRNIPGNPNMVVRNMPNAAAIGIANHIYNVAPKDGSVFAGLDRTAAQLAIRGEPAVQFEPLKFTWLGSVASYANDAYVVFINSTHAAKTANDIKGSNLKVNLGTVGAGGTNLEFALLAVQALGLNNLHVIRGYSGTGPIFLAMQSNELDAIVTGLSTVTATQAHLWKSKLIRPLVQFGRTTRHPDLPDVPTGRELALDDDARALVEFAELPFLMSRPFIAPPNLPKERAEALKVGFMATLKDPAFVSELEKINFDDLSPIDGDAIIKLLEKSASTPASVIARYNALVAPPKK